MKIHNYLYAFTATLIFLTFGHIVVILKYVQILLHHGIYYCQEMAKSFNVQIPGTYGLLLAGILVLAVVFTLFRIIRSVLGIFAFKKSLLKKKYEQPRILSQFFESLGLRDKIVIFIEAKPHAFCFGIHNPKIYISTGLIQLMNKKELAVILKHETYHLEHRDTLTLLLAAIIESFFPFFPVVSDFIRVYRTDREVAADNASISTIVDNHVLKNAIKKLLQFEPNTYPVYAPALLSIDTLEARINSINMIPTTYKRIGLQRLGLSIVSLVVLLGLMTTPVNALELHEGGRDVILLCSSSTHCESVCRKQTLLQLQSFQPHYTPQTGNFSSAK